MRSRLAIWMVELGEFWASDIIHAYAEPTRSIHV